MIILLGSCAAPLKEVNYGKSRLMDTNMKRSIKNAIDRSPRNAYVAELHAQVLKYAADLQNLTGQDFCVGVGIPASYAAEFSKMKKLADRLGNALDRSQI